MTSQVRNLWCRSQNKMGPSSKYVDSQRIVDLRQPQVAMKHHLRSVRNTCVAQSLYSEFRPLIMILDFGIPILPACSIRVWQMPASLNERNL